MIYKQEDIAIELWEGIASQCLCLMHLPFFQNKALVAAFSCQSCYSVLLCSSKVELEGSFIGLKSAFREKAWLVPYFRLLGQVLPAHFINLFLNFCKFFCRLAVRRSRSGGSPLITSSWWLPVEAKLLPLLIKQRCVFFLTSLLYRWSCSATMTSLVFSEP